MSSNRKGFTLIELLIVVVIIGILAAIAIPKFSNTKEKAYLASMKSDLRNLATAQEAWAADHNGAYIVDGVTENGYDGDPTNVVSITDPQDGDRVVFTPSSGIKITFVASTAPAGWEATAEHAALDPALKVCAMFVGVAGPVGPAVTEGEPKCGAP